MIKLYLHACSQQNAGVKKAIVLATIKYLTYHIVLIREVASCALPRLELIPDFPFHSNRVTTKSLCIIMMSLLCRSSDTHAFGLVQSQRRQRTERWTCMKSSNTATAGGSFCHLISTWDGHFIILCF